MGGKLEIRTERVTMSHSDVTSYASTGVWSIEQHSAAGSTRLKRSIKPASIEIC